MIDRNFLQLTSILGRSVVGDDAVFELISIFTCGSEAHKAIGLIIPLDFEKLSVVEVVVFGIGDWTICTFIFEGEPMLQKLGSLGLPDNDSGILNGDWNRLSWKPTHHHAKHNSLKKLSQ